MVISVLNPLICVGADEALEVFDARARTVVPLRKGNNFYTAAYPSDGICHGRRVVRTPKDK